MFLAIIMETYNTVKGEILRERRLYPVLQHLLCGLFLRSGGAQGDVQGLAIPDHERS